MRYDVLTTALSHRKSNQGYVLVLVREVTGRPASTIASMKERSAFWRISPDKFAKGQAEPVERGATQRYSVPTAEQVQTAEVVVYELKNQNTGKPATWARDALWKAHFATIFSNGERLTHASSRAGTWAYTH